MAAPVKTQPVRSALGRLVIYHEVFCGVAEADWHAEDDSIVSDMRAIERLDEHRATVMAIVDRGAMLAVNIGFITAARAGAMFLTRLRKTLRSGIIEITEHGHENMSPEAINKMIAFCNDARAAGYRVVLDDVEVWHPFFNDVLVSKARPYAMKCVFGSQGAGRVVDSARNHGILSIVENIETRDQAVAAVALGATALQGYLYGRPSPIEKLLE